MPIDVTLSGMFTDFIPLQPWKADASIDVTLSGIFTDVKPLQPEKADASIDVTLSGMFTDVKPLQPEKADVPIDVTLSGMFTDVKPLQPEKADAPIDVTLSGMFTDVKPLQSEKADVPIDVTLFPIVNEVRVLFPLKRECELLQLMSRPKYKVSNGQLEKGIEFDDVLNDKVSVPSAIINDVILLHDLKASISIDIIHLGIVKDVKLLFSKACDPIDVTLYEHPSYITFSGITMSPV